MCIRARGSPPVNKLVGDAFLHAAIANDVVSAGAYQLDARLGVIGRPSASLRPPSPQPRRHCRIECDVLPQLEVASQ